jgi:hypothetical protein
MIRWQLFSIAWVPHTALFFRALTWECRYYEADMDELTTSIVGVVGIACSRPDSGSDAVYPVSCP